MMSLPEPLVCLAICVQIRRGVKTTFVFIGHQQNLTLAYTKKNSHSSTALLSMRSTGAHLVSSFYFRLAAVTLRAQHFTADQTQRRRTAVVTIRIWAAKNQNHACSRLFLSSEKLNIILSRSNISGNLADDSFFLSVCEILLDFRHCCSNDTYLKGTS